MGKLRVSLFALLAACGSDAAKQTDAAVQQDAPKQIDAKVFNDAPPSAYDLSCFGTPAPTTADANVTVGGVTETLDVQSQMFEAVGAVTVQAFKNGDATALDTQTSGANDGTFTTAAIATGGTPIDGYLTGAKTGYRTSYLYTGNVIAKSIANVPVPMISTQTFALLQQLAQTQQDDNNNGVILALVSDCKFSGIAGATVTAKQGNNTITLTDFSQYVPGMFAALNVPDGPVTINATFQTKDFPPVTAVAHKKGNDGAGTLTGAAVVPGYF